MKRILKIARNIGMMAVLLIGSSCEEWLSVSPNSEVKYEDHFSSKNGFKDQLIGVYTALSSESLYGANLTFGMLDALGQQYIWTQDVGNYYSINRFEYENSKAVAVFENVWSSMYNGIANTNILLKGIHDFPNVLSADEAAIYEGEALALRAFLHFDLLRMFAKSYKVGPQELSIPYVTEISKNVTVSVSVSELVNLVIKDLKKAALLLENDPIKTGAPTTPLLGNRQFHFNYYAVQALLARVYLFQGDRANALLSAEHVIASNQFPWVAQDQVTTATRESRDGTFVTEGVFVLNNTKLDALTGKYLREEMAEDFGHLLKSSPAVLAEIFESNRYGGFDWRYNYYFETQGTLYRGSSKLWQYRAMPVAFKNKQPLIRISELYLIAAESASTMDEAVRYFNTLRQHRGFNVSYDLESSITEEQLNLEIAREYRKEFIGEGQWFFYCKRKDIAELPNAVVPFNKGFYVLPIPDIEIEFGHRN